MEEILKEVLVKEWGNMFHDKVFIVENLPKKFLYEKTVKMVPRTNKEGWTDGTMVPAPGGELVETLYNGIERSPTGDGGFMFWNNHAESLARLKDIDRYIEHSLPRDSRLVARVPYAQMVGEKNSPPMGYHMIPRVTLPLKEEPKEDFRPSPASVVSAPSQTSPQKPDGRIWNEERKEAYRQRMAKARAAKANKEKVAA